MGEMAEWTIDQILDGMWDDEFGNEYEDEALSFTRDPHCRTCKYCGKYGFRWEQDVETQRWRLVTRRGMVHRC